MNTDRDLDWHYQRSDRALYATIALGVVAIALIIACARSGMNPLLWLASLLAIGAEWLQLKRAIELAHDCLREMHRHGMLSPEDVERLEALGVDLSTPTLPDSNEIFKRVPPAGTGDAASNKQAPRPSEESTED